MSIDVKTLVSSLNDTQLIEMAKQLTQEISQSYCPDKNIVRAMVLAEFEARRGEDELDSILDLLGV